MFLMKYILLPKTSLHSRINENRMKLTIAKMNNIVISKKG